MKKKKVIIYSIKSPKKKLQRIPDKMLSCVPKVCVTGNIFIGYDSCKVYDAVDIHRCIKCNQFNRGPVVV